MNRMRGFYSIVQYVPDGSRAEAANAGVVVYVPETRRIEVQVTPTLERVRQFFKPKSPELRRLQRALAALVHRMETAESEFGSEEDFRRFVAARADALRLTSPRLVVLNDSRQKLGELYDELVGEFESVKQTRSDASEFPPGVAAIFGRLEAEKKVWRPGKIIIPETRRTMDVPLAYQNGVTNYVVPQSLASPKAEGRLPKLSFNGLLIHKHKIEDQAGKLVVLSANEKANPETEEKFAEVLRDFEVRFVPFREAERFADEVASTAH